MLNFMETSSELEKGFNPIFVLQSGIWVLLTYYSIGFAPARFFRQWLASFELHQMALSLSLPFHCCNRKKRSCGKRVWHNCNDGNPYSRWIYNCQRWRDIAPWMIRGYHVSPIIYGQNALAINEFHDKRWNAPNPAKDISEPADSWQGSAQS